MKVLLVQGSASGGVRRHVADVARGVARAGHVVLVAGPASARDGLAAQVGPLGEHPVDDGTPGFVEVEIAAAPRPRQDAAVVAQLRRLAAGADIVHAHGLRAGALAALALSTRRTPLLVTLHNLPVGSGAVRATGQALLRVITRRADVVLGASEDLCSMALAAGARSVASTFVVAASLPTDIDIDDIYRVREELAAHRDSLLVLTVARLAVQKGLSVLVDAAALCQPLLAAHGRDVQFLVAGDGPLRPQLADQIVVRGAPVTLLGARDDVGVLLRVADLVVVPSLWEARSLVIQEAFRVGAPVVATATGGTAELTRNSAVLVPPSDPDALARAIEDVVTTPGRLDDLRDRSRRRGAQLPTRQDMVSALIKRYADLARRRS